MQDHANEVGFPSLGRALDVQGAVELVDFDVFIHFADGGTAGSTGRVAGAGHWLKRVNCEAGSAAVVDDLEVEGRGVGSVLGGRSR